MGLAVLLSVLAGLGSLLLLVTGDAVVLGIIGTVLMAACGVAAVRGYRRREWTWLLGALVVDVVWFAIMMLVLQ